MFFQVFTDIVGNTFRLVCQREQPDFLKWGSVGCLGLINILPVVDSFLTGEMV